MLSRSSSRRILRAIAGGLVLLAAVAGPAAVAHAATYHAYAPPGVYGAWTQVATHLGAMHFSIDVAPVGSTVVQSEVVYVDRSGRITTRPFHGHIDIDTCNCVATVQVRCKGIPTGSAVTITCIP
jgi:multidrug efflux pump subunit AcrA (membrane-fusion protein)